MKKNKWLLSPIGFLTTCLFVGTVFGIVSCVSSSQRTPASANGANKPTHYVITLHGARGTAQSFGAFHQIVKPALEKIDPRYNVKTINYLYPVGDKIQDENGNVVWTVHRISRKINDDLFVGPSALIPQLQDGDKISFIVYSMGGTTVLAWYYDTMFNFPSQKSLQYAPDVHEKVLKALEHTDDVISLGAVYWGSLEAELDWSYLESGDISQMANVLPKVLHFCARPNIQKMISSTALSSNLLDTNEALDQMNVNFVSKSVKLTCETANSLKGFLPTATGNSNQAPGFADVLASGLALIPYHEIRSSMASLADIHPIELQNMSLTGPVLNVAREYRIRHLTTPALAERFKTRWSSLIGVFPCLGKSDKGVSCNTFKSDYFYDVNQGLVTTFSGLHRRETDGVVINPSVNADFLFYTDGSLIDSASPVTMADFQDTASLQRGDLPNQHIFVENQHASFVPVFENLGGALKKFGQAGADAMVSFDASLKSDVAVIPPECAQPETCHHPNYRILLSLLSNASSCPTCDVAYLNRYYGERGPQGVDADSHTLQQEVGSFTLSFNLHLPANVGDLEDIKTNYLRYFQFKYGDTATPGDWTEKRLDSISDPYAVQVGRDAEIMSSHSHVSISDRGSLVRVYFMGRTWAKKGHESEAAAAIAHGVPVALTLNLPGFKKREIEAIGRPSYSTYVNLYMQPSH